MNRDPVPKELPIKPESGVETSYLASCVNFSREFLQPPCVSNPFNRFKMFPQHLCVSAISMHGHLYTNWGFSEASRVLCIPQSVSSVVGEPLLLTHLSLAYSKPNISIISHVCALSGPTMVSKRLLFKALFQRQPDLAKGDTLHMTYQEMAQSTIQGWLPCLAEPEVSHTPGI